MVSNENQATATLPKAVQYWEFQLRCFYENRHYAIYLDRKVCNITIFIRISMWYYSTSWIFTRLLSNKINNDFLFERPSQLFYKKDICSYYSKMAKISEKQIKSLKKLLIWKWVYMKWEPLCTRLHLNLVLFKKM